MNLLRQADCFLDVRVRTQPALKPIPQQLAHNSVRGGFSRNIFSTWALNGIYANRRAVARKTLNKENVKPANRRGKSFDACGGTLTRHWPRDSSSRNDRFGPSFSLVRSRFPPTKRRKFIGRRTIAACKRFSEWFNDPTTSGFNSLAIW